MLNFYAALARRLYHYQWLLWLIAAAAGGLLVYSLLFFAGARAEDYTLGALCVLLWALCLVVLVRAFVAPMPRIEPGANFFTRLRTNIRRGARWVMAIVVTALFGMVLFISSRAIGVIT